MNLIETISGFIWDAPLLLLTLLAGLLFSAGTGFFQLRRAAYCARSTVFSHRGADGGAQSVFCALAGTLGTGSITGVAAALCIGGAGAVLWMWVSAFLGMMTGYAENYFGALYRRKTASGFRGGAMYYIERGLGGGKAAKLIAKPLAVIYAAAFALSAFATGGLVQANTAAQALETGFNIPAAISGALLAAVSAAVIFAGKNTAGRLTEKIVPIMSAVYISAALFIIIKNADRLAGVIGAIFEGAFCLKSVCGGVGGYMLKRVISTGVRRGVFSNEAGMGTAAAAHAGLGTSDPKIHGMWAIFEIFFNTMVMCSLTAFMLLSAPCRLPDSREAFANVGLTPQYFRLSDEQGLVCGGVRRLAFGRGEPVKLRTESGAAFACAVSEGEITYSNVMRLTGIQATDSLGNPLFDEAGAPIIAGAAVESVGGSELVTLAFSGAFGKAAGAILSAVLALFAFSTIIGRSILGAQAAAYLFGERAAKPFRAVLVASVLVGAFVNTAAVWGLADIFNGIMAVINIPVVIILARRENLRAEETADARGL